MLSVTGMDVELEFARTTGLHIHILKAPLNKVTLWLNMNWLPRWRLVRAQRKDLRKAVKWYRESAAQGDRDAQVELGRCYFYGVGVKTNYKKAVFWYRKAAQQSVADAQYALGFCYEKGAGAERNKRLAILWYGKAAKQGHEDARVAIKALGAQARRRDSAAGVSAANAGSAAERQRQPPGGRRRNGG